MNTQVVANWGGHPVKLTWCPMKKIDDFNKVTSVHGCCFKDGKVLLVNIEERGFNYPGGHIDEGETPEQALHREVFEEGYVKGTIQYIGAIEVSHEDNPFFIPHGKYPLVGYQLFYRMDVEECLPFLSEHESTSRRWVNPNEIPSLINDHEIALIALQEALHIQRELKIE
ncbi:MAG: NUDIX hydrolase [Bacillaceae bacterium]